MKAKTRLLRLVSNELLLMLGKSTDTGGIKLINILCNDYNTI